MTKLVQLDSLAKILCFRRGFRVLRSWEDSGGNLVFQWTNRDGRKFVVKIEPRYWLAGLEQAAKELHRLIDESDQPPRGIFEGAGELL